LYVLLTPAESFLMERTDLLELMATLKLYGMRSAYDEVMATGIKRRHEPPRIVEDQKERSPEIPQQQSRHRPSDEAETARGTLRPMKSEPGPPMTLGVAAAAHVRLIVWCRDCGHRVEPDPAEHAGRYGDATSVLDWRDRLLCSHCGSREVDIVLTGAKRSDED
jgi:hypothetical protein